MSFLHLVKSFDHCNGTHTDEREREWEREREKEKERGREMYTPAIGTMNRNFSLVSIFLMRCNPEQRQ